MLHAFADGKATRTGLSTGSRDYGEGHRRNHKRGYVLVAASRLRQPFAGWSSAGGFSVREGVEHRATALPLFARRCAEKWKQWR